MSVSEISENEKVPQKLPQIQEEMNYLGATVDSLITSINILGNLLEPLLRTEDAPTDDEAEPVEEVLVPFADRIRSIRKMVNKYDRIVNDYLNRFEF